MNAYRYFWHLWVFAFFTVGMLMAVLAIPVAAILVIGAVCAPVGLMARHWTPPCRRCGSPDCARPTRGRSLPAPGVAGAGGIAVAGSMAAVGLYGAVLALLLAVLSPTALDLFRRRLHRDPRGPQLPTCPEEPAEQPVTRPPAVAATATPDPVPVPRSGSVMTDEELWLAWRVSFTRLQHCRSAVDRDVLARARSGYLDEMQRRNPEGFVRWMASGARAGSDPARYLAGDPSRSPREPARETEGR